MASPPTCSRRGASPRASTRCSSRPAAATRPERDLRSFIATAARAHSGSVVRIITGKGRNSPGRARLPSTVRRLLNGELKPYCADWDVDADEGAVLVRLR